MVKRKVDSQSEDEAQFSDASSEPKQKSKPPAKKAATKKTKINTPTITNSPKNPEGNASSSGTVQTSSEGDKYVDLGKKKRATVRSFKDMPLLDIREFYGTGSEEKPGKKGISLTFEQWQVLKANADIINELFSHLSKNTKQ